MAAGVPPDSRFIIKAMLAKAALLASAEGDTSTQLGDTCVHSGFTCDGGCGASGFAGVKHYRFRRADEPQPSPTEASEYDLCHECFLKLSPEEQVAGGYGESRIDEWRWVVVAVEQLICPATAQTTAKAVQTTALKLIVKVIANILKEPANLKFRSLKTQGKAVQGKLVPAGCGGVGLLR